jgi:hypothetical protein
VLSIESSFPSACVLVFIHANSSVNSHKIKTQRFFPLNINFRLLSNGSPHLFTLEQLWVFPIAASVLLFPFLLVFWDPRFWITLPYIFMWILLIFLDIFCWDIVIYSWVRHSVTPSLHIFESSLLLCFWTGYGDKRRIIQVQRLLFEECNFQFWYLWFAVWIM